MPGKTAAPEPSRPNPLDVHLGARIRSVRKGLRVSQEKLAGSVGVTFQQIQKYERGTNRVSFSMLVMIARALDCRIQDLIGDVETDAAPLAAGSPDRFALLSSPRAGELLEAFGRLKSEKTRRMVLNLVGEMAESAERK